MGGTVTSGRLTHGTSSLSVTILDVVEWAVRLVLCGHLERWRNDFPAPPCGDESSRSKLQMRGIEIIKRRGAAQLLQKDFKPI
jgi:hypothetical protein